MTVWLPRVDSLGPTPLDQGALELRLRLTAAALGQALLMPATLALGILSLLAIPLTLVAVGLGLAHLAVPATQALTRLQRSVAGQVLGVDIPTGYRPTDGLGFVGKPWTWLRDESRWRDVAWLWFASTGGFVLSVVPAGLLVSPVGHLVGTILDFNTFWVFLLLLSGPMLVAWWLVTPALVRARALADRGILAGSPVAELRRRVEQVEESRIETLDHNAAEIRRIERDLHDGAQARLTAIGMTVGYAESLVASDPAAASQLLREARESTLAALQDLRSLVRGIHPPVLADLGLQAAVENLALQLPLPVTLDLRLGGHPPAPVESAAYFALAECFANLVKHADATRAWVSLSHDGTRLCAVCGDDGKGGADAQSGSGLAGIQRRLAAFDGTMTVRSPVGGPTVIRMEVPCALSSGRTRPSSGTG